MRPRFDYGDAVRVIRNIRNDGTYPGVDRGRLLVRRGSIGFIRQIGTFLQDQIIYSVHFMAAGGRLVGCREQELIPAQAPWMPSRFEARDRVQAGLPLAVGGTVIVEAGAPGEVLKVLRATPGGVSYHVCFGERTLEVPESALVAAEPTP